MPVSGKNLTLYLKIFSDKKNPIELVFQDVSTFDAQNPIVESLLKELDVGKKDLASDLVKNTPPADFHGILQRRLNTLKNDKLNFNSNNNYDLSPPPLPFNDFIPPPPSSQTFNNFFPPPQPPPPSPVPPPSFFNHPSLFPTKNNNTTQPSASRFGEQVMIKTKQPKTAQEK